MPDVTVRLYKTAKRWNIRYTYRNGRVRRSWFKTFRQAFEHLANWRQATGVSIAP